MKKTHTMFLSIAIIAAGTVAGLSSSAFADDPFDTKTTPVLTTDSSELKWTTIGEGQGIPAGAQAAELASGKDWHIVRVKFPPHYLISPHSHPTGEEIWLISGNVIFGFGDKVDKTQPQLKPGAFFALQGGGKHWVWTGDEGGVIDVLERANAPINYVNPADDPRTKKK